MPGYNPETSGRNRHGLSKIRGKEKIRKSLFLTKETNKLIAETAKTYELTQSDIIEFLIVEHLGKKKQILSELEDCLKK